MKIRLLPLFLILFAVPLSAQETTPAEGSPAFVTPRTTELLQPGDIVRLWVWREPDISGEYPVGPTGEVVFPKIGSRKVTDVPPQALRQQLIEDYRIYLRTPSIELQFLRRVSVSGEVNKPGLYHLDPTQTVADAIVLAGGVTQMGRNDVVQLRRNGETVVASLRQADRIAESPISSGDQLYVPERRWSSRNAGVVSALVSASVGLVTIAFLLLNN